MKKASKKPREWWAVVRRDGKLCAFYGTETKKSLVQGDLRFEKKGDNDPLKFYRGAKVIKVREVLKPRRGKK